MGIKGGKRRELEDYQTAQGPRFGSVACSCVTFPTCADASPLDPLASRPPRCHTRPLADVAGVAWSPGDEYLASVGLDSLVVIYSGHTFGQSHGRRASLRCMGLVWGSGLRRH